MAFHWWDTACKENSAERSYTAPLRQDEGMSASGQVDRAEEDIFATNQEDDMEKDMSAIRQGDDSEEDMSASDSVDYVDEELYAEIKDICKNIDFTASFDPGDVRKYDLYKEKFKKFINGEVTVWIKETGEKMYI